MKKTNLTKILALALSLVFFICGVIAISASAEATEKSAKFKGATLNYGAETRIAYILELSEVEASDVTLKLYKNADLSDEPAVVGFSGEYYNETYPVFYSFGVSAKDLADYIYAVPYAGEDKIGDVCRYSVAEYCYSVLANDAASADLVALAEDLIAYGASAQQRLINIGNIADEALVSEYNYAYTATEGVTLDGYKAGLYAPEEKVVPSYNGGTPAKWKLIKNDGTYTEKTAAEAAEGITLTDSVCFEPIFKVVADFEEGYINDNIASSTNDISTGKDVRTDVADGASEAEGPYLKYSVVADPTNAANNVLKVEHIASSASDAGRTIVNAEGAGNCYVFETKIRPSAATATQVLVRWSAYDAAGKEMLRINFYGTTSGMTIDNSDGSTITKLTKDTWYDIKIEYYKSATATENYVKFYVDGTCIWVSNAIYGASNVSSNAISYVRLQHGAKASAATYYDDMSLTAINKEYTTKVTFEDGYINDYGFANSTNDLSTGVDVRTDVANGATEATGPNLSYSVVADPENAANKVLKVDHMANNVGDAGRSNVTAIGSGNCSVFETGMRIASTEKDGVTLRLALYDTANTEAVRIYFKAKADGTLYIYNSDNAAISSTLKVDTWYDIKIERYVVSATENYVKFWVGTECVWESATVKAATANAISTARLQHGAYTETSSYYDDISLTLTDKEYVAESAE